MEIIHNESKQVVFNVGDVVKVSDEREVTLYLLLVEGEDEAENYYLVSLDRNYIYGGFNHPVHAYNHIKKHYPVHEIIEKSRLKLTIE